MKYLKNLKINELNQSTYRNALIKSKRLKQKMNFLQRVIDIENPIKFYELIGDIQGVEIYTNFTISEYGSTIFYKLLDGVVEDFNYISIKQNDIEYAISMIDPDIENVIHLIKDGNIIEEDISVYDLDKHLDFIKSLTDDKIVFNDIGNIDLKTFKNGIVCEPDDFDPGTFKICIYDCNGDSLDDDDMFHELVMSSSENLTDVLKAIFLFLD